MYVAMTEKSRRLKVLPRSWTINNPALYYGGRSRAHQHREGGDGRKTGENTMGEFLIISATPRSVLPLCTTRSSTGFAVLDFPSFANAPTYEIQDVIAMEGFQGFSLLCCQPSFLSSSSSSSSTWTIMIVSMCMRFRGERFKPKS